ncbi:MAG: signal peptidase I [Oleiphilaceae bacterium]|nr:signal peptidase I [Oleiphilaceae bacterium]
MTSDMHFDFEAALVLFAAITGLIWLVDRLLFAKARKEKAGAAQAKEPALVEFARSFFPIVLAVLLLRSFVVEPFRIPSGSMLPTLHSGDFILVNKYNYGLRLPVLHTKFVDIGTPIRGDVAVFRFPPDPSKDFIKRIVGLPGDIVSYRDKVLYVNGVPAEIQPIGEYNDPRVPQLSGALRLHEELDAMKHDILIMDRRPGRNLQIQVPQGHYFVMGDNRDGSDDSRRWGFVPDRNLVGRAFMIWMSWDVTNNRPVFSRIGQSID